MRKKGRECGWTGRNPGTERGGVTPDRIWGSGRDNRLHQFVLKDHFFGEWQESGRGTEKRGSASEVLPHQRKLEAYPVVR